MNWASALRPCGHAELDIWSEASADNCPQERSCSRYCRNSKHNWLLRSWFQRSIFLTPFKERKRKKKKEPERPQDRMLSIRNYYRSSDQNDNKKSSLVWQNGHPVCKLQGGESQEMMEHSLHVLCEYTLATAPWRDSLKDSHRPEQKISRALNLGF